MVFKFFLPYAGICVSLCSDINGIATISFRFRESICLTRMKLLFVSQVYVRGGTFDF